MSDQPITTERQRHADLGQQAIDLVAIEHDVDDDFDAQRLRVADTIVDVLHAFERMLRAQGVTDVEEEMEALLEASRDTWAHESTDPELDLSA